MICIVAIPAYSIAFSVSSTFFHTNAKRHSSRRSLRVFLGRAARQIMPPGLCYLRCSQQIAGEVRRSIMDGMNATWTPATRCLNRLNRLEPTTSLISKPH